MGRELSEMTLEELWQLFPIFLVEHDDRWDGQYRRMEARLSALLREYPVTRISHIGSTAVRNIWAKDIVDVLIELGEDAELAAVSEALEGSGFIRMASEPRRISLNLGYTKDGFADEVFHIHLRYDGDNDELYFRDYLNEHPQTAAEYEKLKLALWKKYEHDRDAYTREKTAFVRHWTQQARSIYKGRY